MKRLILFFITVFFPFSLVLHAGSPAGEEDVFRIVLFSESCREEGAEALSSIIFKAFSETLKALLSEARGREVSFLVREETEVRTADLRPGDLVLATGPAILKQLIVEKTEGVPLVALEQACLPELFSAGRACFPLLLSSDSFWQERFFAAYRAVRFQRPGFILPVAAGPEEERLIAGALIRAGEAWQKSSNHDFFFYEELADNSSAQCMEAVDYLFFDEVDAMILDGNPCFDLGRPDFDELMSLLHQRGILPLSLADPRFSGRGILLGVVEKDLERRGKSLAVEAFHAFFAEGARKESPEKETEILQWKGEFQAAFFLDLGVARKMGFDPPAFLIGLSEVSEEKK